MGKHLQISGSQNTGNLLIFGTNGFAKESGFKVSDLKVNFSNGVEEIYSGTFGLGGSLIGDTDINGESNNLNITNINGVLISNNGSNSNSSSILELNSNDKAFLLPRLSDPASNITSPENGMLVYDSTNNELQSYINGNWIDVSNGTNFIYENGITKENGSIKLGGDIIENTTLNLDNGTSGRSLKITKNGTSGLFTLNNNGSWSLGLNSNSQTSKNVSIGEFSVANGNSSIAIGESSQSIGDLSIVIGKNALSDVTDGISIGNNSDITTTGSIGIGKNSGKTTGFKGDYNISIGFDSGGSALNKDIGSESVSIGFKTSSPGNSSIGIGDRVSAVADGSIILGHGVDSSNLLENNDINSFGFGWNETSPSFLYSKAGRFLVKNLPVYDNDSDAGTNGVASDEIYKTSTGELRIKL